MEYAEANRAAVMGTVREFTQLSWGNGSATGAIGLQKVLAKRPAS